MIQTSRTRNQNTVIFNLKGELRLEDIAELRETFFEAMQEGLDLLVLDLSQVLHMDTSGISLFVSTKNALNKMNANLVLCGLNPKTSTFFAKTSLDHYFDIRATFP